jgi:toxin ParE1/3/4
VARVIWSEPAVRSLEEIAEYIALDKPQAASRWVGRVLEAVGRLANFPDPGSILPEIPDLPYRQVVVAPCRVLCRHDGKTVWIIHLFRGERPLREKDIVDTSAPE